MVSQTSKSERTGIRQRNKLKSSPEFLPNHYKDDKGHPRYILPTPTSHLILVLLTLSLVFVVISLMEQRMPTPLFIADEPQNKGRFIAERAKNNLINLTSMGPRVTGSYENEVLAVNFLKHEIGKAMSNSKPVHKVELDIQRISGSFTLTFLDGMTHVYKDVQNVVVKISSQKGSEHSILMNCHFDSVSDSPGGSDDGASCVVMLEILRLITQSDEPLKHNIVMLFNGAEENFMQASHGFITKHKWAKEIRAVVNLESCGAGGREVMFQSGPNHPWLMKIYSETVGYPFASSLAQEIFQSGYIPADTDFRIFRDFGGVPGLDFAWYLNGYVYHTKSDDAAHVPLSSLQRTGDNILVLVRGLASADELTNTAQHKEGHVVFFDVLGAFIMFWSLFANNIINIISLLLSVYSMICNFREATDRGLSRRAYLKHLFLCVGVILVSWILSFVASISIALTLTGLGRTMSWYARPVWLFFLYVVPVSTVIMGTLQFSANYQRKIVVSPWTLFQLYYDSYQLLWSILLLLCTIFRIQSGFIPLFWVVFPAVGNLIRLRLFKHWRDWKWLIVHSAMMFPPFIQCAYMALNAIQLFIPLMGRSGAGNNAELILCVLVTFMFVLLFSYTAPIILLVRTPKRIISLMMMIFGTALAVVYFTPLGFPYSGNPASLAQQRYAILHAERSFHNIEGVLTNRESGFWFVDLDLNSPHILKGHVPEVSRARLVDQECEKHLYCGMPYFYPVISFIWKTHWIDGPEINIPVDTTLVLESRQILPNSLHRFTFNVSGPDHMGFMVSPVLGTELVGWSILDEAPLAGPKWNERQTYFVYYSYADKQEPWVFSMDFRVPKDWKGAVMDVVLTSHFLHGPHQQSEAFNRLIAQFPDWTTVTGWQSTYKSFIF